MVASQGKGVSLLAPRQRHICRAHTRGGHVIMRREQGSRKGEEQGVGDAACSGVGRCGPARQETGQQQMKTWAVGAMAGLLLMVGSPANAAEPFLKATGARGLLADEEEQLYRLRQVEEGKVREELTEARGQLEEEAKKTYDGKLCATPFGVDVVGITEFVALTGALVGGIAARRRKQELEKLNEQLRTINTQLRQQARAGTLYAPGLTYAPTGGVKKSGSSPSATKVTMPSVVAQPEPITPVKPAAGNGAKKTVEAAPTNGAQKPTNGAAASVSLASLDEEEMNPDVKQCQNALKEGKRLLKDKDAAPAMVRFEKALMLAKATGDKIRERRAVRGLAAANRILGRFVQSIEYLERVLEISREIGDHVGDADAYGTIADIYTEMGEFEKAAEFYDKYIGKMAVEGPV